MPNEPRIKDSHQLDYFTKHGSPLLLDYVNAELIKKASCRVVKTNLASPFFSKRRMKREFRFFIGWLKLMLKLQRFSRMDSAGKRERSETLVDTMRQPSAPHSLPFVNIQLFRVSEADDVVVSAFLLYQPLGWVLLSLCIGEASRGELPLGCRRPLVGHVAFRDLVIAATSRAPHVR